MMKQISAFYSCTNSLISAHFPIISLFYYTKPRAYFYRKKHAVNLIIKGKSISTYSGKSCLFFSVHKSATTFMSTFLTDFANETGQTYVDYNSYFFTQGVNSLGEQSNGQLLKKVFKPTGYLYGPLRYFLDVERIEQYRIVLFLRDPRDVLTSQYFSIKNTHPLNTVRMIERRKAIQHISIDEYVKLQADRFLNTYNCYSDKLLGKPNVLLLRYEDMVADFAFFLKKIDQHFETKLDENQQRKLNRTDAFITQTEDITSHKRKVTPGDYKQKLQPDTIDWLNKKFAPVLTKLGYV